MKKILLTTVIALSVITSPAIAQDATSKAVKYANVIMSKQMTKETIENLTQKWLSGWNIGDKPFDAERFRPLFSPDEIGVFDNVQGDVIVLRSVEDYIQTWKPFMEPLTHWSTKLEDLNIRLSGDLAVTTFKLVGTDTRGPDGESIPFGQYGTHVWENQPGLGWRIVLEHLTSYDTTKQ